MEKIVIHKPGDYRQLKLEAHPDPVPGVDQVVVRTRAVGVNYADCCVRWGVYKSAKEYVGWPITPGFEFAGDVAAVGPGVTDFKVGDKVFGVTRFDAYATHVRVPRHQLFHKPDQLSYEQAAGFPAVYLTAYHALYQNLRLRPGMNVLVHSAAGGVGTALLQLSRIAGCKTVGVVGSAHKIDVAKGFGADHVIDKSSEDLWKKAKEYAPGGYDVILDANGPETLKHGYEQLAPSGKLISYGFHTVLPKKGGRINYLKAAWGVVRMPRFSPFDMCDRNKGVIAFNVSFLFDRKEYLTEGMTALLQWLKEGKILPPKVTLYPFSEVGKAHEAIESGKTTGKLILTTVAPGHA